MPHAMVFSLGLAQAEEDLRAAFLPAVERGIATFVYAPGVRLFDANAALAAGAHDVVTSGANALEELQTRVQRWWDQACRILLIGDYVWDPLRGCLRPAEQLKLPLSIGRLRAVLLHTVLWASARGVKLVGADNLGVRSGLGIGPDHVRTELSLLRKDLKRILGFDPLRGDLRQGLDVDPRRIQRVHYSDLALEADFDSFAPPIHGFPIDPAAD